MVRVSCGSQCLTKLHPKRSPRRHLAPESAAAFAISDLLRTAPRHWGHCCQPPKARTPGFDLGHQPWVASSSAQKCPARSSLPHSPHLLIESPSEPANLGAVEELPHGCLRLRLCIDSVTTETETHQMRTRQGQTQAKPSTLGQWRDWWEAWGMASLSLLIQSLPVGWGSPVMMWGVAMMNSEGKKPQVTVTSDLRVGA